MEAADKKSRSMTFWPILAFSLSTSPAEICGAAREAPHAAAMFSIAVLFHPEIVVGWMPLNGSLGPMALAVQLLGQFSRRRFLANDPRATFALNSAA